MNAPVAVLGQSAWHAKRGVRGMQHAVGSVAFEVDLRTAFF